MSTVDASQQQEAGTWWSRACGGREVLTVAMPLVVSSLSWTVMTFIDRMFLFQVSGAAMAAAFFAGTSWFVVFCFHLGICSYANTFVSQYFGDGQPLRIGSSVWQSVWFALTSFLLAAVAYPFAPWLFGLAGHSTEILAQEIEYFQILCFGGPGMVIATALSCFYSGRGKTKVVMYVDTSVVGVNLLLDYLWIFGYAGFPAMGIAGAGWATVVSLWLKAVIYVVLMLHREHREQFNTFAGYRFDRELFGRLVYYGGPCGAQMLLDVMGFTIFILLIGKLGTLEAEATTMAFSVSTLAFMPVFGFGMAASILVGQRLGENREDLATRATWTSLHIGVGYIAILSVFYVLTPDVFLMGFFEGDKKVSPELRTMAANLLCFVAAYNLFDAMLIVFSSALKGAGDTRFILRVSLVMASLLALISWLTIDVFQLGIYESWIAVTVWIWCLGIIFFRRFIQGQWREMRVIEQQGGVGQEPESLEEILQQEVVMGQIPAIPAGDL